MTIELTTTTTKKIEIKFPCYTRRVYCVYYCKDEKTVICVEDYDLLKNDGIGGSIIGLAFGDGWEFSTKEEFEESYNRVLNNFNQTIN